MPAPIWLAAAMVLATPDDCREAYAAVNYRMAAEACLSAIPSAPPDQLAGLYRLAGLSVAALGDSKRAQSLFDSWLALDPKAALDASVAPKLRAPFESARRAGSAPAQL